MRYAAFVLPILASVLAARGDVLKINGSTTVNLPVAEAAELLRVSDDNVKQKVVGAGDVVNRNDLAL